MLSQTSEHAIRALLFLAQRPGGEAVPAARIAAALGAPANYLAKTLNALARRGLIASTRGPAGGFRLRRPADRITLAEVDGAFGEVRASLRTTTIADLLNPKTIEIDAGANAGIHGPAALAA